MRDAPAMDEGRGIGLERRETRDERLDSATALRWPGIDLIMRVYRSSSARWLGFR